MSQQVPSAQGTYNNSDDFMIFHALGTPVAAHSTLEPDESTGANIAWEVSNSGSFPKKKTGKPGNEDIIYMKNRWKIFISHHLT